MKKHLYFLSCLCILILTTSCNNITEEVIIREDGSGEMVIYSDMISNSRSMANTFSGLVGELTDTDSAELAKELTSIEDKLWEKYPEPIDSIIDFQTNVPDSVKNHPTFQKIAANIEGFIKGSRADGYVHQGMRWKFTTIDQLKAAQEELMALGLEEGTNDMVDMEQLSGALTYSFKQGVFKKNARPIGHSNDDEDMDALKLFIQEGTYTLKYHFPSAVKTLPKNARYGDTKSTIVFEYPLLEYISNPAIANFEIKLK